MARSGLYKSDVKRARETLLAQGKHPSVDAVRIALGNTGSKTTIHKYLKELDEEDADTDGRKASVSDALQNLVARLAAQLQGEAQVQLAAYRAQQVEQEHQHAAALAAVHQDAAQWRDQAQHGEAALRDEQAAHNRTHEALQGETIARHTAEQKVADLKERLTENDEHRRSLEEKHQHARDALEHYRQSVKEQREQDQRRHEQQIQQLQAELRQAQQTVVVKQEEVTRLNQEGARLVADLSHAQKALYDEQAQVRQLTQKLDAARAVEQRCGVLEAQATERENRLGELKKQLAAATASAEELVMQLQAARLEAASAKAALAAQQTLVEQWRASLDAWRPSTE